MWVPSEVFLSVSVFNIKPDYIVWNIKLVHLTINILHVIVCDIIPATLMVCDGKILRKLSVSGKLTVCLCDIARRWAQENKQVQKATFRHPMCRGISF